MVSFFNCADGFLHVFLLNNEGVKLHQKDVDAKRPGKINWLNRKIGRLTVILSNCQHSGDSVFFLISRQRAYNERAVTKMPRLILLFDLDPPNLKQTLKK